MLWEFGMIGTSEAVFSMGSFSFLPLEFSLSADSLCRLLGRLALCVREPLLWGLRKECLFPWSRRERERVDRGEGLG